jgi:hypothetical protein
MAMIEQGNIRAILCFCLPAAYAGKNRRLPAQAKKGLQYSWKDAQAKIEDRLEHPLPVAESIQFTGIVTA